MKGTVGRGLPLKSRKMAVGLSYIMKLSPDSVLSIMVVPSWIVRVATATKR